MSNDLKYDLKLINYVYLEPWSKIIYYNLSIAIHIITLDIILSENIQRAIATKFTATKSPNNHKNKHKSDSIL